MDAPQGGAKTAEQVYDVLKDASVVQKLFVRVGIIAIRRIDDFRVEVGRKGLHDKGVDFDDSAEV